MQNEQNQINNQTKVTKPKTLTINPYYKEMYYKPEQTEVKDTVAANHSRSVMWNYMMNLSMQNAVIQASKRGVTY